MFLTFVFAFIVVGSSIIDMEEDMKKLCDKIITINAEIESLNDACNAVSNTYGNECGKVSLNADVIVSMCINYGYNINSAKYIDNINLIKYNENISRNTNIYYIMVPISIFIIGVLFSCILVCNCKTSHNSKIINKGYDVIQISSSENDSM